MSDRKSDGWRRCGGTRPRGKVGTFTDTALVSNLTPEEAVIIVNAYGETLESLAAVSPPRWETDDDYRRDVMNSPDPVSLFRRTYDLSLLPYSKNGIREALHLLLAHPDVDAEMKERLRMGLLALDDFIEREAE